MVSTKIFLSFLLLSVAGCAGTGILQRDRQSSADSAERSITSCIEHFSILDKTIDAAGVRDGGEARMENFPYLRVNRFLASFANDFQRKDADNAARFSAWVAELGALDHAARVAEISNLPMAALAMLQLSKSDIHARTNNCAALMIATDINDSTQRTNIIAAARVPDDYSAFKRLLGAYPIAKIPFFRGVENWQRSAALKIQSNTPQFLPENSIVQYWPAGDSQFENINSKFKNAPRNIVGMPVLSADDWLRLFDAHAPVFALETATDNDRIGSLKWNTDAARESGHDTPSVDIARPAVYRRISHTRINGKTYSQLVYSAWFPSRPRKQLFDLLSGALDSVIWRVTLDDHGEPLIYDSIHGCGCYHLFFPTSRVKLKPPPEAAVEWAFVPKSAPLLTEAQRIVLHIAAASHYIASVGSIDGKSAEDKNIQKKTYAWRDDNELRTLPIGDGNTRSIFQPDGLINGTERGEQFLFWPMGIASPGAMRQWGRHATAFVGIRHFDDADLFDLRFAIVDKFVNKY